MTPSRPGSRVLVVRLSALGDVLMTLPLVRQLRRGWPGASVHFAVQDELAPVLEGHPELDRVVPIPVRRIRGLLRSPLTWPRAFSRLAGLEEQLRAGRYDLVLDAHGNFKSGLVSWLTDAPRRIGPARGEAREGNGLFLTDRPRRPPEGGRHRRDRALSLLSVLGLATDDAGLALPAYPRDWARGALAPLAGPGPLALLHPGTSPKAAFKRWPAARFGELATALREAVGARVAVVAGPGEEHIAEAAVAASGGAARALPAPPDLRQLGGLLGEADLFVGADSGPGQLATALGVASVILFGPKDPGTYGPRERGLAVLNPVACAPCGRRRCHQERVLCMEDLTVATVVDACRVMVDRERSLGLPVRGDVRVFLQR